MELVNNSETVRTTSCEAHWKNQLSGHSSKLSVAAAMVLENHPSGLHRGEIAKELESMNLITRDSSMSHPVRILQEMGVVVELVAEKRPTSTHKRHVIKLRKHLTSKDTLSKKQLDKYEG